MSFCKRAWIIILCCFLFSCKNDSVVSNKTTDSSLIMDTETLPVQNTKSWIENFREFRSAVYNKDVEKVKLYFNFPISDSMNDIWFHVISETSELKKAPQRPFSENDFEHYYSKIFPKVFVQTILKIKTETLLKTGNAESPEIKIGETSYKMYATFDKTDSTLQLNLNSETPVEDDDLTDFQAEFSVIYNFKIGRDNSIKFVSLGMAG